MTTTTDKAIETLNKVCAGWTESRPGGLACNPSKAGGIIDSEIVSGEWFVIFNDERETLTGFATREDAAEAFAVASIKPAANTIQAGQTLTARSACDAECVFRVEVLKRAGKWVTLKLTDRNNAVVRKAVKTDYEGNEVVYAYGNYSMAPIFRAV